MRGQENHSILNRNVSCQKIHKFKHNIQFGGRVVILGNSVGLIKWNLASNLFNANIPVISTAFPGEKTVH